MSCCPDENVILLSSLWLGKSLIAKVWCIMNKNELLIPCLINRKWEGRKIKKKNRIKKSEADPKSINYFYILF